MNHDHVGIGIGTDTNAACSCLLDLALLHVLQLIPLNLRSVVGIDVLGRNEECEDTTCVVDITYTSVILSSVKTKTYRCRHRQSHNGVRRYLDIS